MDKSPDAFRTISEVADHLDTPAHVLRFWESRFPQVRPVKRAGGRRYYRPSDVALLAGIRRLLHAEGLTIRGVQKILREQGVRHVAGLAGGGSAALDVVDGDAEETVSIGIAAPETAALDDPSDDWDRDEWGDGEAVTGQPEDPVPQPRAPKPLPERAALSPALFPDDLPLFALPQSGAPGVGVTGEGAPEDGVPPLPAVQQLPLTGLRALRAAQPPVIAAPVPVDAPATVDLQETNLAPVLASLRALRPGALARHREAIAALMARLEVLRAAQGRLSRGSRG